VQGPGRQRRSDSELPATDTEATAIATPAITGLSMPAAANGMPGKLQMNAKHRF
jgi:hypothetical protein